MQRPHYRLRLFSIVACATFTLLAALIAFAQQQRQPDANALRNAGQSGEWTYGGDYAETRYSPLRQIDASNANRLGLAWTQVVGGGGGNQEATPLFWNGVLYGITNWSIAFAMNARTGRELWRFDREVPCSYAAQGENRGVCCGILNRGIALYEGKIIVPVLDGAREGAAAILLRPGCTRSCWTETRRCRRSSRLSAARRPCIIRS
jgi:glucose dehydrogenase